MKARGRLLGFPVLLAVIAWSCGDVQNPTSMVEPVGPLMKPAAKPWRVPGDFSTIQDAIDSDDVQPGQRIVVGPGSHAGAHVTKAVEIRGEDGAVIDSGPLLSSYMPCGTIELDVGFFYDPAVGDGSGSTISHFEFMDVSFPVMSRGANGVTVTHCQMSNPIQGISNWNGSAWTISHNQIRDLQAANGGGIGILIGGNQGGGPNHIAVEECIGGDRVGTRPASGGLG